MKKGQHFLQILLFASFMLSYSACTVETPDDTPYEREERNPNRDKENNRGEDKKDTQDPLESSFFSEEQLSKANTAEKCDYLSESEKQTILYMNLARLDGEAFTKAYLSDLQNSSNPNEQSLIDTLKTIKDKPMLIPNQKLCEASKFHANDIGSAGEVSHNSTDGTSFGNRIRRYYNGGAIAENIAFGNSQPLKIVRQLLIDNSSSTHGHRKNILSEKYCRVGVAIAPHASWSYCCVQDFSDNKGDNQ